jgi:hypothetical protein
MGMTNHKMRNISARARRRRIGIRAIGAIAGAYQEHNSSLSTGVRGSGHGGNIANRPNTSGGGVLGGASAGAAGAGGLKSIPGSTPSIWDAPAKLPEGGYHFGAQPGQGSF